VSRPLIDRTGHRVGRLAVLSRADDQVTAGDKRYVRWLCRCDCGAEVKVMSGHLNEANTTSCGCALRDILIDRNAKHGGTGTPEHEVWRGIKERCSDQKSAAFKDYGGRGITLCERWQDFQLFLADMGPRPSADHSIDREDVNGHYEPGNCRWATPTEQSRNRRNNIVVKINGQSMPLSQAVETLGGDKLAYKNVHKRMKYRGMTFDDAMTAIGAQRRPTQQNLGVQA
jgi:hypothetical protein